MAETTTPTTPPVASGSAWEKLLNAGASIYSGYTNAAVAKSNTAAQNAAAKAAAANASTQQSSVMKYALIAVGGIVVVGLVIFLIKKK